MGIQINGQTDIISATDGSLTISGATLPTAEVTNLNATGIVTASGFVGDVTGNLSGNVTGNLSGNVTGNLNSTGVSTVTTLSATSITGVSTAGITTAYIGSINNGPLAGFRNIIINGNFDIWQRGTSSTVTTAGSNFLTDRYLWNTQGNTATVSRQAFTAGQTDVPYEPTYFHRIQITSSVASQLSLEQRIEDVRTLAGQTATLSFYAKGAAGFTLNYFVAQGFGTGGSPSSSVSVATGTVSLTTSWQKFTITFSVPSISGKTLGTNNDHFVQIGWQMPASATNTFDLAQVQLESGTIATPFERRPIGQELSLCQRYYYRINASTVYTVYGTGWNRSTSAGRSVTQHPVIMRTSPSSVDYNLLSSTINGVSEASITSASIEGNHNSPFSTTLEIGSSGAFTTGFFHLTSKNSTSSYLGFSAEL